MVNLCHVPGIVEEEELCERKVSLIISDEDLQNEDGVDKRPMQDASTVFQLLTHIPDIVINCNQKVIMPARKECIGVAMFADISGFTALCEKYANMLTKDSGTDKLTATLNNYIGKIVDCIIKDGGDVLKFAGDAILASWGFSHSGHNVKTVVTKAIRCGLSIQEKCDNQMTEVGVLLRVKIAMAIGSMVITFVGVQESKQFDLSGSAIDEVGAAEKHAKPSDVILTPLAWTNCDQDVFKVEQLDDAMLYRVSENRRIVEMQKTSQGLALVLPGFFSDMKSTEFASKKKVIFCPEIDKLIAKCPDCHLGLPKALLPDTEDGDFRGGFGHVNIVGRKNWQPTADKEKKFDRQRVSFNLDPDQIEELRAYVTTPVLDKLDHGQDLEWLSEMRHVSVLFINMKLPDGADDAARALQKAFEVIYEATLKLQGNLNKVFSFDKGCTFVVIFGLPGGKHEDDGPRALKAGHMIYESLHAVAEITDESIGVTTGRAFCGVVGHKDRHEYTVIGRKVNMAARLMTNYPGKLSCDSETFEASKSKLKKSDFLALPVKVLKGIKDPGIVREYNPCSSSQEEEKDYDYPILGREKEIMEFSELLQNLKSGKRAMENIIIIEGEAGIGKTRLLEEFMDMAEEQHFRLNYLELDSTQTVTPYHVVGSFISTLLSLEHRRSSFDKEHILFDVIQDAEGREDLFLLNDLLGTEIIPDAKFSTMSEDERNSRFHAILLHIVQKVTEQCPNMFVVDNAQFVDVESWGFFFDFVNGSSALLVLAMRPNLSGTNQPCDAELQILNHSKTKMIYLAGLQEDLMSDLACQMLQVCCIPVKLNDVLRARSNGVPSWCEQLVKQLQITNVLQTGPNSLLDDEESIHEGSTISIPSVTHSHTERPNMGSANRRWSIAKQIRLTFKRTSNASALSDHVSMSESESRRSSEPLVSPGMRRSSIDSDGIVSDKFSRPPSEYSQRGRRMSIESAKSVRLNLEHDETLYPLVETNDDDDEVMEKPPLPACISHASSGNKRRSSVGVHLLSSVTSKHANRHVFASVGAVPDDIEDVCILSPGMEISDAVVPESVNDVVVARLDRMSPNEQLILKCASVLGMSFTREVLSAIVPRKIAIMLDTTLYRLSKERLLECGSLALNQSQQHNHRDSKSNYGLSHHNHHKNEVKPKAQVLCGCYESEGIPVINLSQTARQGTGKKRLCLYFHFCNTFVREAAYDLWLEDQRKALHERAAMYLETQMHLCKSCGGTSFIPGVTMKTMHRGGITVRDSRDVTSRVERKRANAAAKMSSKSHQKGFVFTKVLVGKYKTMVDKEEIQNETGYYSKQRQTGNRGEGVGRALVDMAGMITKGLVNEKQPLNNFKSALQKMRGNSNKVAPDPNAMTRAVIAEFQKFTMSSEKSAGNFRRSSQQGMTGRMDQLRSSRVDVSECQCNYVLSVIFPQLVFHWRASNNKLKTFHYLIECAAAFIAIHSNMQALSFLSDVEEMIIDAEDSGEADETFFINAEDKSRVEFLHGQALMNMNRFDDAIKHFILSLKHLGNSHPKSRFGTFIRTLSAYMTQVLHRKMPDTFTERREDTSRLLIEEARCLTQLSRAYHIKHDFKRSYMVALEQLNAAEEAEEDWIELMTAYSSMVECCQLTGRMQLGHNYEKIALAKMKSEFRNVEEVLTAIQLHSVLMSFRLYQGNVTSAINAGYEALHLSNNVNDLRTKIEVIPLLSQALLLLSRVQACHEVLHELHRAAMTVEDLHGKALYFCTCMDLLLEAGRPIESFDKCLGFFRKIADDPSLSGDVIPRFYLAASISVMLARQKKWQLAFPLHNVALELEPMHSDMFLYCRAYARVVEYNLLSFRECIDDQQEKIICKTTLKKLKIITQKYTVLLPRLLHLQAYFAFLCGRASKSKLLIEDCLVASRNIELMFEVDWVMSSKAHWFNNDMQRVLGKKYNGRSQFVLPQP